MSTLKTVKNQIVADWESEIPPTETARTYHYLEGREVFQGASGHRVFWFEPASGESGNATDYADDLSVLEHRFEARLMYRVAGKSMDGLFDALVDESVQLLQVINQRSTWPSGVEYVRCTGYQIEPADEGDEHLVIVFPLIAVTQE